MEEHSKVINREMRNLVANSCQFETSPGELSQQFHIALLKFYFSAIKVTIDYESKVISIYNSKPITDNPLRLYDINRAIADKVGYNNLEETLNGCLEKGQLQNTFYKKLLLDFENLKGDDNDVMSA